MLVRQKGVICISFLCKSRIFHESFLPQKFLAIRYLYIGDLHAYWLTSNVSVHWGPPCLLVDLQCIGTLGTSMLTG